MLLYKEGTPMSKRDVKVMSLILACVMIIALFVTGCSGSNNQNTGNDLENTSEPTSTPDDDEGNTVELEEWQKLTKYEPMVTLTTDRFLFPEDDPAKWDENAHVVWAKEKLGINWQPKFTAVDHADAVQKIQLLAASDDLPDVIVDGGTALLKELYKGGHLLVMEDLIEKYGSPLTKYIWFEEYQKMYNGNGYKGLETEEGKFYAIPLVADPLRSGLYEKGFIRKDILDEMGYDVPTSIEELDEIFDAYKDMYPDNAALVAEGWMFGTLSSIYSAFGGSPNHWVDRDGELVYGGIVPEMKTALAKLSEWYKKGYIAKEFNTLNWTEEAKRYAQGDYLMITGHTWLPGWLGPQMTEKISTAELAPLPFLSVTDGGEVGTYESSLTVGWPTAISANCKNPEAVIYEMNEVLESGLRNEEDLRAMFDFKYPVTEPRQPINPDEVAEEGLGVAKFDYPEEIEGPAGFLNGGIAYSPSICYGNDYSRPNIMGRYAQIALDELNRNNGDMNATFENLPLGVNTWFKAQYIDHGEVKGDPMATKASLGNYTIIKDAVDKGIVHYDYITGLVRTESYDQYWSSLFSLEQQTGRAIIKGEIPLDDFDKFVTEWKASGGDQITKEMNEWYAAQGK